MQDYINIGKLVATFGLKGELILQHSLAKKLVLKGVEAIFVEQVKGSYLPYFLLTSKAKTHDETFVQLEGISTKEQAHLLISKQVCVFYADFRRLACISSRISLLGYKLLNEAE